MAMRYVLDACALIALMNNEAGANLVAGLYKRAVDGDTEIIINKVNLFEVYYGYLKEDGEEFAQKQLAAIESSVIKINDTISNDLLIQAARLKGNYKKISLADSFAVAQTIVSDAVLVTSDHHELDAIDKKGIIKFLWIR